MENEKPGNGRDEMELVPSGSRDLAYDKACTCAACGTVFNRDKAFCPSCGLGIQEMQQPARYEGYTAEITRGGSARSAKIFALLSLILGIAGPLALGVGWLLAIIFGFTAVNLMKGRGGFPREKKFAVWGISLGFFWPVAFFILLGLYSYGRTADRIIARNERAVETLLVDIAAAQRFIKSGYFITRDGRNLYASADELSGLDHRLIPADFDDYVSGYSFEMRVVPDKSFQVFAVPERYGFTGRKSFYIDETGVLRGDDAKTGRDYSGWSAFPRLRERSVYDDYDNLIAENLIHLARRLASEAEFERARNILYEIRTKFYMLPAAARVDEAAESLERHAYEHRARRGYEESLEMLEEGRLRDALSNLKRVRSGYGDAVIISDVNAKISEVENRISSILEKEAKELFEKAAELEKEGDYDRAIEKYRKITRELDSTSYYERASRMADTVESMKAERKAEDLFSKIAALNLEKSYREAVTAANSLINHYSETDFVKQNIRKIRDIISTAVGEREKNNAINAFQQANFNAAIQAGEAAIESNPALREVMTPILRSSYLKRAESLFSNEAYAEAVPFYESWMNISEYDGTDEHSNYLESLYNVARKEFTAGRFPEAKERLERLARHFRDRDELWYMLGAAHAVEKDYQRAVSFFRRALSINDDNIDARFKLALCRLIILQQKEDELKSGIQKLSGLKRGAGLFYEINSLVNALNAKDLEIKHIAAGTGGGEAGERRRARLPAERDAFESETRTRLLELQRRVEANRAAREEVMSTAKEIHDMYNEINTHIMRSLSPRGGRRRREFVSLFRRKRQAFEGYFKLERGLNQEMRLEENGMLNLNFALTRFSQERAFDSELREMSRLIEGIGQMGMERSVEEGREEILRAADMKIPVEEYIKDAVRPSS